MPLVKWEHPFQFDFPFYLSKVLYFQHLKCSLVHRSDNCFKIIFRGQLQIIWKFRYIQHNVFEAIGENIKHKCWRKSRTMRLVQFGSLVSFNLFLQNTRLPRGAPFEWSWLAKAPHSWWPSRESWSDWTIRRIEHGTKVIAGFTRTH